MRIKLDENVPVECLPALINLVHEVSTVKSESLTGCPDKDLWPIVQQEKELLITQDKGFGDLRIYPPGSHNGILLLRPGTALPSKILAFLTQVVRTVRLEEISGCLAVADSNGIRIRRSEGREKIRRKKKNI